VPDQRHWRGYARRARLDADFRGSNLSGRRRPRKTNAAQRTDGVMRGWRPERVSAPRTLPPQQAKARQCASHQCEAAGFGDRRSGRSRRSRQEGVGPRAEGEGGSCHSCGGSDPRKIQRMRRDRPYRGIGLTRQG
jgi:hypothetical protein